MLHEAQYFYILISFSLSLFIHYFVIELSHRRGIFLDEHDKIQKMHTAPTPRIGGLGVFLSSMFILNDNQLGGYLLLASIPAFVAGFLEDYSGKISPEQRLAIIFLSPVMAFIMIPDAMLVQLSVLKLPGILGMLASSVVIVALVNGVNFTDGQNGLASGTVLISLLSMMALSWVLQDRSLVYICLVLAASVLAFLPYNFPKGRIFLGDGGAYFLGFMVAALAIILVQRHAASVSIFMLPVLVIYPLWEVIFSTLRKLMYDRISPFRSDEFHLHQLLFRNHSGGRGQLPAVIILPAQIAISCFLIVLRENSLGLLLLVVSYITLYITVYIYERRLDVLRNKTVTA